VSIPPPPPGFQLDDDEDDDVIPPPPSGFSLDRGQDAAPPSVVPPRKAPRNLPSLGLDSLTGAVDGDTARLASGRSLRLWGVDAPEKRQQGWNRQGQPVPIGQQAREALSSLIANNGATIGNPVSMSYGRPVAPVTLGNVDLGQKLARQGNVMAAPSYLKDDPDRQFQYMQAERLARQNGLGIHDTMFQQPADFRKAPMQTPDRETVAQFWDTPTPWAGLRPEVEAQVIEMTRDPSIPLDQVAEYAKANGGILDMDSARASRDYFAKYGNDGGISYRDAPRILTDAGDGKTGAAVRGFGTGVLANGLDEAGALVDTLGLTDDRENLWNSDRRFADIWSNNQQQNSAILGFDEQENPWLTTGSELAGGLVVPFGRAARTVPELARVGAAYGGAAGFLGSDGEFGERAISGAIGAPVGAALGAGAGKLLQQVPALSRAYAARRARLSSSAMGDVTNGQVRPPDSIDIGQPEPMASRVRDVIDINDVPPPPPGYRMQSMGMDAEPMPRVSTSSEQYARAREPDYLFTGQAQRMDQPLTEAQRRAMSETIDPRDVLPIPGNQVSSIEEAMGIDAGRFAEARAPNERGELSRQTVRAWNGAEVPKVGPVDMVGWLRLNGGLMDQGGELSHMGLTNAARKADFVGQEQRFGPLVNHEGMSLDDAALRAWEAGYFPEQVERPSVNQFLDALRETHDGGARRFLADDQPEIDRFYGAQQQRYDLEQQRFETGGPVFTDRSEPAGPDQPFAPPEAFEEWPAGGPDFAGNINLKNLDSPQDISRALDMTQRRVGFDAATRGRVSQAETERLAADLGMSPEKLLSRRQGEAFNAEEALAARQILAKSGNELVNMAKRVRSMNEPGEDVLADFRQAWMRHVAIQEQVSGMTAEAGRALQQFRQMADSRAVPRDVLTAIVKGGGGRNNLQDAAQTLLEAVEQGPGKFNVLVEKAAQPKWRNRISELYINMLLSWPQTHAVNVTSNTLTAIAQIPEHMAGSVIGKARQILPGANIDRVIGSEVGARAFGLLQGAKEGARLFSRALKTGEPSDFISKVEGQEYHAIPGKLGTVVRMPTRFLTAEDELFKGIARRMEMNGQAVRMAHNEGLKGDAAKARIAELMADPTDDMLAKADDYGRYLTFQTQLGPGAQDISNFSNRHIVAKLFLPFVRTPTNLLKFAIERSPAAPLLKEWKADFHAGGARRDMAIAKMVVGTGFGAAIYEAALDGRITGSAPSDPKKSRLLYADGWKPYSIKVGDTYYSYKRLDPFSTTLGVAADLATLPEGMSDRQREDKVTLVVASIMGNLASKTWLSGVSDVVGALHDPERNADNMMQRLVGALLIPNLVAGTARTVDPTQREVETIGDSLQARIPGMRDDLMPRRDIWGEPIRQEGGLGPDWLSPVWVSQKLNDPVNRELLKIGYAPGILPKKVAGRELTPEEYDRYTAQAGQLSHDMLGHLIEQPGWHNLSDDEKEVAASKMVAEARRRVRGELFGGQQAPGKASTPPPPPGFKMQDAPPPPAGYKVDGNAGGVNVYADLQQAIPGVRFTSGYRNEAYQADMRRRGYRPAANSGHLSGSGLDMLPPPGRSMSWLRERVGSLYPDAKLLNEGDHLHATFPGYYGAPALGGARTAGLSNPLANMPPPPAGFRLDQ
jgi:endonuclease YncB( thermonuclease family)